MADLTEREQTRKDAIKLLKERLAEGRIKSMELKLLMELLKDEEEFAPISGKPMDALFENLPFGAKT
jgi:hypothetical protein